MGTSRAAELAVLFCSALTRIAVDNLSGLVKLLAWMPFMLRKLISFAHVSSEKLGRAMLPLPAGPLVLLPSLPPPLLIWVVS